MNYMLLDDAALVAQIAREDRKAFETLYDRHAGQALGLAVRVLGERNLGEDVVQETFWRVWKLAKQFDVSKGNVKAWLFGITHHLAIDTLRRRKDNRMVEIDAEPDDPDAPTMLDLPDEMPEPLQQVWEKMSSEKVRSALATLPEAQRQVIEMTYFQGLTHKEVATNLKQPAGTIHTRARLALGKLRELLAGSVTVLAIAAALIQLVFSLINQNEY